MNVETVIGEVIRSVAWLFFVASKILEACPTSLLRFTWSMELSWTFCSVGWKVPSVQFDFWKSLSWSGKEKKRKAFTPEHGVKMIVWFILLEWWTFKLHSQKTNMGPPNMMVWKRKFTFKYVDVLVSMLFFEGVCLVWLITSSSCLTPRKKRQSRYPTRSPLNPPVIASWVVLFPPKLQHDLGRNRRYANSTKASVNEAVCCLELLKNMEVSCDVYRWS